MRIRILDLDGSITAQKKLLLWHRPEIVPLGAWGPQLRMACRWGRFRQFERELDLGLRRHGLHEPALTFCGSGDFHHVSLALLRRLPGPFNLLVIDKHPDWMRGVPILHCGTWLHHAAQLPQVRNIFHVGGETDFDNAYRWMAPTPLLRSGRLTLFPACRTFQGGFWESVPHQPIRTAPDRQVNGARLASLLWEHRPVLQSCPLYISLDKDVLIAPQAPVNWDSGHLIFAEVQEILRAFCRSAGNRLAGIDVVGDWSPVVTQGWLRSLLHRVEHPALATDPRSATKLNQKLNSDLASFFTMQSSMDVAAPTPTTAAA
jgi:hypothetical protein